MIDSSDRVRIEEAKTELHRIISDREMNDSLLLVFANKQDIAGAMSPTEVTEKLQLSKLKDKIWYVVPSCATTGEGLFEGLVRICHSLQSMLFLAVRYANGVGYQGWLSNNVKTPPQKTAGPAR